MDGTAAPAGIVPMWGQKGEFDIKESGLAEEGPFRIDDTRGASRPQAHALADAEHAVHLDMHRHVTDRSFIGVRAESAPGITPDEFAREVIAAYIRGECKGNSGP